jgi:hypothetical protein
MLVQPSRTATECEVDLVRKTTAEPPAWYEERARSERARPKVVDIQKSTAPLRMISRPHANLLTESCDESGR